MDDKLRISVFSTKGNIRVIHRAYVLFEILFFQRSCLKGETDDSRSRNPRNRLAEPKGSVEPSSVLGIMVMVMVITITIAMVSKIAIFDETTITITITP